MKKIIIFIYLLRSLSAFGYQVITNEEDLYTRDIPIFYGLEDTLTRIENENNKPIWALNLSGGSARAFAHIGVIKKLEESGFRPDVIITNSMGSIVGMAYAAGMSVADIEDIVKTVKLSNFFDLVFPTKGGFLEIHRFEALLYSIFGDLDISETAIPVFVVTEDLKSKRQVILSKGNFVDVLKAAFAISFYFEPVTIENYSLVDGGATSLVPLLPFKNLFPNMVVSSTFYAAKVSLKNPLTILNVTMGISKTRRAVKQLKEFNPLLIRCDVEDISFMAFNESKRIIGKGYESCSSALPILTNYLEGKGIYSSKNNLEVLSTTEELHTKWENVKIQLHQTTLPAKEPGWAINPGLESWHSFQNTHYLNQNYYPVIKSSYWFNRNLMEGELFYTGKLSGTILRINLGLNDFLFMNIENQINFSKNYEQIFTYEGNYIFSKAGAIFPIIKSYFEPGIIAEFIDIGDPGRMESFLRPGITWESETTNTLLDLRYIYRKTPENITHGISAEYNLLIPLKNNLSTESRIYFKNALTNLDNGVELSFNDFFRSSFSSILANQNNFFPSYLILNNNIVWNFGSLMSGFGELISMESSKLYLFNDLLLTDLFDYKDDMGLYPTLGIGIKINASLIGLKPYILNFSGGWDFKLRSPFITFSFGNILN